MAKSARAGKAFPKETKGGSAGGSSVNSGDLSRLERILELMGKHEVAELEWEKSGERILLRTSAAIVAPLTHVAPAAYTSPATHLPVPAVAAAPSAAAPVANAPKAAPAANSNVKQIVSPFVGTFYRAASPGAEYYVKEGQSVKRGDVLCIIEAMKLMNEIEAEFPGRVVQVLVENGQPVEFGEPLFLVEAT